MMRPGMLVMSSALALMLAGTMAQSAPETASQKASTAESQHAAATGSASTPAPAGAKAAPAKTVDEYAIGKNGEVGPGLVHGYLFFGEYCARCHGPSGRGSSFAPSLLNAAKTLSKFEFESTVINGLQNKTTDQVMPAFGTVSDVVLHLNDIYTYLLDRADGKVRAGMLSLMGND